MNKLKINCEKKHYDQFYVNGSKNYNTDCGFDLFCSEDQTIYKNTFSNKVNLQVKCQMINDDNIYVGYKLYPRSSMGSKTPLRLSNSVGIIDPDYTGFIMGLVDNLSQNDYNIKRGDRLFQLVSFDGLPIVCEYAENLEKTERGSGGFGSTN